MKWHKRSLLAAPLTGLLLGAGPAQMDAMKIVVAECETHVKNSFPRGNFSAYVEKEVAAGSEVINVKWFGTPREHFEFNKCMTQRGYKQE